MSIVENKHTPWACMHDPNSQLVWWIHSKCACSFYKVIFKKLGWVNSTTNDIDWNTNIVFSHIRNPLAKHRMGIIEWFYFNNKENLLKQNFNNPDFFQMLSEIVHLDVHSMSIKEHLGKENSTKIHWIPIDTKNNHVQDTFDFIEQYSVVSPQDRQLLLNLAPVHVSGSWKKQCNKKLLDIPPTSLIVKSIDFDQWLYDRTTKKNFQPDTYSQRIDYLKSLGMSQQDAELHADQDVMTGEYLNWSFSK